MAVFLERRMLLAMKTETTEGTYVAPAGSDANLLVYDVSFEADVAQFERKPMISDMSPYASIPGKRQAKVRFKVELKGSGTAGTAPAFNKLIRACGYGEALVGGVSATYSPSSAAFQALSIALYTVPESGNNIVAKMRGVRGSMKFSAKVGEPVMLEFELMGVYNGVVDAAALTASGLETTKPQPLLNTGFTMQSFSHKISTLSIDLGVQTALREDIAQVEGFVSCLIVDKVPTFSFDPEKELVLSHDYFGIMIAGTEGAMSCVIGATAGNICTITAPKCQYVTVKDGSRNGIACFNIDGKFNRSSGNDELVFAFT